MNIIESQKFSSVITSRKFESLQQTDTELIVDLLDKVFADGKNYLKKIHLNPELVSCVIAETEGKIVGFAGITKRVINHENKQYVIGGFGDLVIDQEFQGHGLGFSITKIINNVLVAEQYDIGMGFCKPDLVGFYQKANWIKKEKGKIFTSKDGIHRDSGIAILYISNPVYSRDSFWFQDDINIGSSTW